MKKTTFLIVTLISFIGFSQETSTFFQKADVFLKDNVINGKVAYSKIYSDRSSLDELMALASKISIDDTDKETYQAFWINAYNLSVIKGIVDNYPIKSPLDVSGFFDKSTFNLSGKQITLNDIENQILRKKFKDARFHFVLVCGANGCPPLISKAYLPNTLQEQLEQQTQQALNGNFLKVDVKKKRIEVSEIMKWYKEDFTHNGSEIDFINIYRTEKIPSNFKINYSTYDWNLNKQ